MLQPMPQEQEDILVLQHAKKLSARPAEQKIRFPHLSFKKKKIAAHNAEFFCLILQGLPKHISLRS